MQLCKLLKQHMEGITRLHKGKQWHALGESVGELLNDLDMSQRAGERIHQIVKAVVGFKCLLSACLGGPIDAETEVRTFQTLGRVWPH
jgi:hypothetical protein